MGNLANLQRLSLSANQFSGCLPDDLWDISPDDNDFAELDLPFCDSVKDGATDEGDETTDKAALVALYNATDGDNWTNNTNWLSDWALGEWHGVTTNDDGQVTRLDLDENQLSGSIPAELGNLTNLQYLSLVVNQLSGSIPAALGNLANLQYLSLNGNQLSGSIPAELGNLTNLQNLSLSHNQLSGQIPPALGNLTNLTGLNFFHNQLSGQIPPTLGNLANLQWLYLGNNQLSGSIPAELGNLTNLQALHLGDTQLSGCVPEGLRNVENHEYSVLGLPFCGPAKDGATNEGDETTGQSRVGGAVSRHGWRQLDDQHQLAQRPTPW